MKYRPCYWRLPKKENQWLAEWKSNEGTCRLPCGHVDNGSNGDINDKGENNDDNNSENKDDNNNWWWLRWYLRYGNENVWYLLIL